MLFSAEWIEGKKQSTPVCIFFSLLFYSCSCSNDDDNQQQKQGERRMQNESASQRSKYIGITLCFIYMILIWNRTKGGQTNALSSIFRVIFSICFFMFCCFVRVFFFFLIKIYFDTMWVMVFGGISCILIGWDARQTRAFQWLQSMHTLKVTPLNEKFGEKLERVKRFPRNYSYRFSFTLFWPFPVPTQFNRKHTQNTNVLKTSP